MQFITFGLLPLKYDRQENFIHYKFHNPRNYLINQLINFGITALLHFI